MDAALYAGMSAATTSASASVSAGQVLSAAAVLLGGIGLALLVRLLVTRAFQGPDSSPGAALMIARFVQILVVAAALVYALNALGVRLTPVLGALGIGGIALALAIQPALANAIASVVLQIRRPFRRGDQIATLDLDGTVQEVNLRTVLLRTFDGNDVLIPSSQVLENPITNFTRLASRRTSLEVGMAYDTDLEAARDVLLAAMATVEGVHATPAPEAWVREFSDSAITLSLRYWHDAPNDVLWRVRHEVAVAVKRALDAEGMVIAFPQQVVYLRS